MWFSVGCPLQAFKTLPLDAPDLVTDEPPSLHVSLEFGQSVGRDWLALGCAQCLLMPLAGAAIGAASGAIGGALSDVGLNDTWMKETAAAIQPGTAALFVLVRKVTADKVLEGLKGEGGTVMKTSLDHTKEAALQAALAGVQAAVPASPTSPASPA